MNTITKKHYKRLDNGGKFITKKIFNKYNADDKRRIIAIDALFLLNSKIIEATQGTYFDTGLYDDVLSLESDTQVNLKVLEKLSNESYACEACAKGALFIGHVIARNDCTIEEADCCNWMDRLNGIFYISTLNLIEAFFESYSRYMHYDDDLDENNKIQDLIIDFNDYIPHAEDRLRLILENIIEFGDFQYEELVKHARKIHNDRQRRLAIKNKKTAKKKLNKVRI